MDHDAFFEVLRGQIDLAGTSPEDAAIAVIAALGEALTPDEAAPLTAQIPAPLARWMRPAEHPAAMSPDGLYARVSSRSGLPLSRSLELTQVVCRVLGAGLSPDARARLHAHLGPDLARLFDAPDDGPPLERPLHVSAPLPSGEGHTLADGKPGPRRTIAETRD